MVVFAHRRLWCTRKVRREGKRLENQEVQLTLIYTTNTDILLDTALSTAQPSLSNVPRDLYRLLDTAPNVSFVSRTCLCDSSCCWYGRSRQLRTLDNSFVSGSFTQQQVMVFLKGLRGCIVLIPLKSFFHLLSNLTLTEWFSDIELDTHQVLYRRCGFVAVEGGLACERMITNYNDYCRCGYHVNMTDLTSSQANFSTLNVRE